MEPPSREELLQRCRKAAENARRRGVPPRKLTANQKKEKEAAATDPTTAAGQRLLEQYRQDALSVDQLRVLAEYEKDLFETCGGDAEAFCRMKGVDAGAIPIIKQAIEKVKAGVPLETTLAQALGNRK